MRRFPFALFAGSVCIGNREELEPTTLVLSIGALNTRVQGPSGARIEALKKLNRKGASHVKWDATDD